MQEQQVEFIMTQNGKRKLLFTVFLTSSVFSFMILFSSAGVLTGGEKDKLPSSGPLLPASSSKLLNLYKERAELCQKNAKLIDMEVQAAGRNPMDAVKAAVERDVARLAYWRMEKNLNPDQSPAIAFIRLKVAQILMQDKKGEFDSGTLPLSELNREKAKVLAAEIRLEENLQAVRDRTAWIHATETLKNYPHKVTEEQLRALFTAELPQTQP